MNTLHLQAARPARNREDVEELTRADLVFYGVDHSGPTYEARVFLNNPRARDADTARDAEQGYAGSFAVFGHSGCFGAEGHCLPDQRTTDEFDRAAAAPAARADEDADRHRRDPPRAGRARGAGA